MSTEIELADGRVLFLPDGVHLIDLTTIHDDRPRVGMAFGDTRPAITKQDIEDLAARVTEAMKRAIRDHVARGGSLT